jgi:hypothetical protein
VRLVSSVKQEIKIGEKPHDCDCFETEKWVGQTNKQPRISCSFGENLFEGAASHSASFSQHNLISRILTSTVNKSFSNAVLIFFIGASCSLDMDSGE